MSRNGILVLAASLVILGAIAPNSFAAGTLTVTKTPGAAAGTVTGTVPSRSVSGNEGEPQTVINCGSDCSEDVDDYETCIFKPGQDPICTSHTETVTLTQQPAAGWQLDTWSGCSSVTGGTCERTMPNGSFDLPEDRTVTANYRDIGAPTVAFSGPVESSKLHGVIAVGATAGDNAGVVRVKFFINNSEFANDSDGRDGWSASFNTSGYSHADEITVKAVAFDAAGNASVLEDDDDRTYRIDSQTGLHFEAPTPAQNEWVGASDPAAEVGFAKNDDTPTDTLTYECDLGSGFAPCSSPLGSSNFASDGTYTVIVKGTDDATPVPNTAQTTRTFRVDRTAPAVDLTRPLDGSVQPSGFTPEFTVTEANPADTEAVRCSLDGGAFGACGALSGLSGGHHTFAVKAVDQAGNATTETHDFDVDATPPVLTITGGPAQNEIVRSSSVHFTFTSSDASPLARTCRIDGAFEPCSTAGSHTRSGLSEGAHVFEVRAVDAAGNGVTRRRDFVVNAVRPTIDITGGPAEGAVIRATEATFRFRATGGSVQCSLDSETAFGPCATGDSHRVSGLSDGGHTFRVRVRDASNDEVIRSRTFNVDTSAPPRPPVVLNPTLSTRVLAYPGYTRYSRLVVKRVPKGATVTVKCKGKKCPAKSFTRKKAGNVKLSKFVKKKLRAGTKLTIRVTKPGTIGKQFVIRIRAGKRPTLKITQIA